jgi:cell wall-associated NlpC family hydrolase
MDTATKNAIYAHAEKEYPRECCGLLIDAGGSIIYKPCTNKAQGNDHFILSPDDYAHAEQDGQIIAVVHSHPDQSPKPSQADMVACEASGHPWHIVSWPGRQWDYLEPKGYQAPLIGRKWAHGVLDCYSLIRDYYKMEMGIDIPNFTREDDWWYKGQNLYVENFKTAGFYKVLDGSLKLGDVIIMQVLANVPNHGAIYLGNDIILHHLFGRLSCREVYGGYYRKHTSLVVRYGPDITNSEA